MDVKLTDMQIKDVVQGSVETLLEQVLLEKLPIVNFFVSAVDKIKSQVLQRKYNEWQEMVSKRLATLEKSVFEDLGNNETFATTLLKTTELALQTNSKKMEFLANAVKYVSENNICDDYLVFFLNCMAKYTYSHLSILYYFHAPYSHTNLGNVVEASPLGFFQCKYIDNYSEIIDIAIDDLIHDKLLDSETLERRMDTKEGILAKQTTQLGDLFIEFFGIKDVEL